MLYYTGRFGPRASIFPYGKGPILTIGEPCERDVDGVHTHSLTDIIKPDKNDNYNRADGTPAPMVHQWDRCYDHAQPIVNRKFPDQGHLFN